MVRRFLSVVAIVCLAVATLLTLPALAHAAGWFNQSQDAQQTTPTTQVDQYAQANQYTQEDQYAQLHYALL